MNIIMVVVLNVGELLVGKFDKLVIAIIFAYRMFKWQLNNMLSITPLLLKPIVYSYVIFVFPVYVAYVAYCFLKTK